MSRIVLWTIGAAIALYVVWNILQILLAIVRERRRKSAKGNRKT